MTFEYGEGRITHEPEMLPAINRPKILSELPLNSVSFVPTYNLAVDMRGYLRLASRATVHTDPDELESTIRIIKVSEGEFIVDRSYTHVLRSEGDESPLIRVEEWGQDWSDTSGEVGVVIGLIDNPSEFELAAPIILREFGVLLKPIELDTDVDTDN